MSVRLLGPLDLFVDGVSFRIGGPRERAVLASLALGASRVTSMESLVDAVWGDDPPRSARSQVQACISGLRKLFRDVGQTGEIMTAPPGYVLQIPAGELDSAEFTGLVAAARAEGENGRLADAAGHLRRALDLWRGPALDGIASSRLRRGAVLLEDARRTAIEERVRLDLELGQHEEICGELRALVQEHPLNERLCRFLMLALYRAGRQVEALEVGRRARTVLVDEVGLEPGQELRDLEAAILNRDPALDFHRAGVVAAPDEPPAAVTPRQLPCSIADFVGRESHIAEIKRLLAEEERAAPYSVRIVAISGQGGVGKSTLALRVAHEMGDVFPDGHLYADLRGSPGDTDHTTRVLARFLRALGVTGTAMPASEPERALLFRSLLADKRLLVLLDDAGTEQDVLPLLPGGPTCPVIVTSRMRLTGLAGAHLVGIDPFDTAKSTELLARIVGAERVEAERDDAVRLVELCAGLPLALRIAGARLASMPHWRISRLVRRLADEAKRLDELSHRGLELRSSIALTYRGLPARAKRLFRLFALTRAPDFPAWTAAALLDVDLFAAEEVLASLIEAQLVDTIAYGDERVRYRMHELVRLYAVELLGENETAAERGAALARLHGGWLALAEKAHRAEYGGDYVIVHGSAPRWQPAGRGDDDPAHNPIEWWESERRALVAAVREAAEEGDDELCWDLALTSTTLFEVRGYFDDWRETAQLAYDTALRAGNRTGQAATLYSLGSLHMVQKRFAEAERYFTASLELFEREGNTHGAALVLRDSASVNRMQGNFRIMLVKYESALAKMRAVGDPIGEATILRNIAKHRVDEDDYDEARLLLDEALAICRRTGHRRGEAQVLNRLAELHLGTGQVALARQAVHDVLRIVRDIGDRIGEAHALYCLGLVRRREGRADVAEETLINAVAVARRVGDRLIEGQASYALGVIELARNNNAAAAGHLLKARRLFVDLGASLCLAKTLFVLSEIHEGEGRADLAAEEFQEAARIASTIDAKEATRLLAQMNKVGASSQDKP